MQRSAFSNGTLVQASIAHSPPASWPSNIGDDCGNEQQVVGAIEAWKFEPAARNGTPVAACLGANVTFTSF
jgi:hypothetical protein